MGQPPDTNSVAGGSGKRTREEDEKYLMLSVVNDFLQKAPVYGLPGPLLEKEVRTTNYNGILWLHTTNLSHRFRYQLLSHEHGVLWEALALNDDLLGVRRDPNRMASWAQATNSWTKEEATNTFFSVLKSIGLTETDLKGAGAVRLEYEAEPFEVRGSNGKLMEVTPFHKVRLREEDATTVIAARFRYDPEAKRWELTFWLNNVKK